MSQSFKKIISFLIICLFILTGCQIQPTSPTKVDTSQAKIYFFDSLKNELVAEPLGENFKNITTQQEQVAYIIDHLVSRQGVQLTNLQSLTPLPYLKISMDEDLEENPIVKFYFTSDYYKLTPAEKIGIRASVVYSLTELSFINGVAFYVEDLPLMTSTGKTVDVIYPSQIKQSVLDPNPATTPYTLSLYFTDDQGKLEKEERCILVSDSASIEKLLLEELIKGPTAEGLKGVMPNDVKVNEAKLAANGVCQVDLSFDPKSKFFTTEESKVLMIQAIVNSLTELPDIKKVVIFLDGKSGIAFTQNIDFGDILERSDIYLSAGTNKK